MNAHSQLIRYILFGITFIGISLFLSKLLLWARKGHKAAIIIGALFLGLGIAPDPVFEKSLQTIREAKKERVERDNSGDPPTTDKIE